MKYQNILSLFVLIFFLCFSVNSMAYGIDWGDDSGKWSNDGECDDPRFSGPGTDSIMMEADRMRDATDCRKLFGEGRIWLNPDTQGSTTITRVTIPQVEALLRHQGFTNITVDSDNDLVVRMNGYNVLIIARDNNYTNIKLRFSVRSKSGQSFETNLEAVNQWNIDKKFTKAHVRKDSNSITLEMDVPLFGGVSIDHIIESLRVFDVSMREFLKHIDA